MNTAPECDPLAPRGSSLREWSFLERYPELDYFAKRDPAGARRLDAHYRRVTEFAERYVAPRALEIDRRMHDDPSWVPEDLLRKACEYRLYSAVFPEILGGSGTHLFAAFLTGEVLATHCVGIANLFGVNGLGIAVVMASFDPRALGRVADLITRNERRGVPTFLSTCNTEPGAGSDAEDVDELPAARIGTLARRVPGGYRLSGTKVFISNASLAALHVVIAFTDPRHRPEDLVVLLVPRGTPGVSVVRNEAKLGQRACPAGVVVFDDAFVPDASVCRAQGGANGDFTRAGMAHILGMTRMGVGGFAAGVAEGAYRTALRYATTHDFMGTPLDRQQWARVELADMAMRAQVARSVSVGALLCVCNVGVLRYLDLAYQLGLPGWLGRGPIAGALRRHLLSTDAAERLCKRAARAHSAADSDLAASMGDVAKVSCSDLAMLNCQRAISLMGKDGLRHEHGAEKLLRDVKLLQIYEGTNQIITLDFVKRRLARQLEPAGEVL